MPSLADAAIHVPSGVNLQLKTYDLCYRNVAEIEAFVMSHNFTLLSSEQERSNLSS